MTINSLKDDKKSRKKRKFIEGGIVSHDSEIPLITKDVANKFRQYANSKNSRTITVNLIQYGGKKSTINCLCNSVELTDVMG